MLFNVLSDAVGLVDLKLLQILMYECEQTLISSVSFVSPITDLINKRGDHWSFGSFFFFFAQGRCIPEKLRLSKP